MEEVKEEEGGLNRGTEHEVSTFPGEGYQIVLSCACFYTVGSGHP